MGYYFWYVLYRYTEIRQRTPEGGCIGIVERLTHERKPDELSIATDRFIRDARCRKSDRRDDRGGLSPPRP